MICFLCRCFGEIDPEQQEKGVDLQLVKERIKAGPPLVKGVEIADSLCLDRDFSRMAEQIRDSGASKVLICACAASSKGDEIRAGLKKEGIDATIAIEDIREGCAWIHQQDRGLASEKACRMTQMAVAALSCRESSPLPEIKTENAVLVVGAGPAGLAAAKALAASGVRVHLIERAGQAGGMLRRLQKLAPGNGSPKDFLSPYLSAMEDDSLITSHLSAKLVSIDGDVGSFTARMTQDQEEICVNAGAVILATGARALLPQDVYRYRELAGVVSAMEFENKLKNGETLQGPLVFIQCVGVRDENRPYCSTICCPVTLKNAIQVKTDHPATEVIVLYRDMMCPGAELERYYRRARALGVTFIRFESANPPAVFGDEKVEIVRCLDVSLGREITLEAETVVLSTGLTPHPDPKGVFDNVTLDGGSQDFFGVKPLMNPVQTDVPGVFVCGSARWPVLADQAVTQGEAAAMKALALLSEKGLNQELMSRFRESKFAVARVAKQGCSGCGNCVAACPFEACALLPGESRLLCRVNPVRCTGCGTCVSVCPNGSIQLPEQTSRAVGAMLSFAFGEDEPVI